ncbi:MAG: NAD(P)/FAD-dependent oxidoreductase [Flavobacteriaceae bacterium]|nr:NAD(P)/FAD-dependent oxidoreductase [Flavobacteriaceae bacterium]
MIKADIIIIGAGPVGLFTVFEAGLMKLRCHIIDTIPQVGGQLSEIYPKKPIYDIPGIPFILAEDLISKLMSQISPFKPGFTLGERAEKIIKEKDNSFIIITDKGTKHKSPIIIISGGLGSFEPRKPNINNLFKFEKKGVEYMISNPNKFLNKKIFISGGGDSALDWAIYLAKIKSNKISLIHRTENFRANNNSVKNIYELENKRKIKLFLNSEVIDVKGEEKLKSLILKNTLGEIQEVQTDFWFPLFGLIPKLGPIEKWGLKLEKKSILVNNKLDYQTNIKGIFAVGDVNTYNGKLKLILCGFHEATLAVQSAYKILNPNKKYIMKYTTIQGVKGFDD